MNESTYKDVFRTVKQSVTAREAAEFYGLQVKPNGMVRCPFHDDRNPSMKVDIRFYCFGCLAKGDVIDFVSKLFGLSLYQAALKLIKDFNLSPTPPEAPAKVLAVPDMHLREALHCLSVLWPYERLLKRKKEHYAPKTPEEEWNPMFGTASIRLLQVRDAIAKLYILYMLKKSDKERFASELISDGTITRIENYLKESEKENTNESTDNPKAA